MTGTVDDLRPHLESAAVYCAPLRFAAGIQNKLLEALAMEIPVVTTPIAAAGLRAGGDAAARGRRRRRRGARRRRRAAARRIPPSAGASRPPAAPTSSGTSRGRPPSPSVEGALERATGATARRRPGLRHHPHDRRPRMTSKGFSVALIGCDGAGKTTVARTLERETDLPLHYLYMGVSSDSSNRQLPTTKLAHRIKRARGAAPDTAGPQPPKPPPGPGLAAQAPAPLDALDAAAHATGSPRSGTASSSPCGRCARGAIVVFDRHFVADYHAADMAAEQRTLARRVHGWLLLKTYPHPDLIVFLDAPAEVLFARKGEGTIASLDAPPRGVHGAAQRGRGLRGRAGHPAAGETSSSRSRGSSAATGRPGDRVRPVDLADAGSSSPTRAGAARSPSSGRSAARGMEVIAADSNPRSAGFRSRFATRTLVYPEPSGPPGAVVERCSARPRAGAST